MMVGDVLALLILLAALGIIIWKIYAKVTGKQTGGCSSCHSCDSDCGPKDLGIKFGDSQAENKED